MLQLWTGPHGLIAVGDFPNDDLVLSQILVLLIIVLTVVHMTKVGGQEVRLAAAHKTRLHPHPAGGAPAGPSAQSRGWDQLMMGNVTS